MKCPKQILISISAVLLICLILVPRMSRAQVVNEATKKRISIGIGAFTDFWLKTPDGMKTRTINQGINVFGTYNMPFGKSNFSFAIGLSISIHNLYWNYMFKGSNDSLQFVRIPDGQDYKRSKLTMPYLEIPIEFRFKSKSKFAVGVGFKVGYMIYGHSKYVGSDYIFKTNNDIISSFKNIKYLEKFAYGPTLRFGYKWANLTCYYSLSSIFQKSTNIDMYPISVGFVLMPF